jgi:hypothetical protein
MTAFGIGDCIPNDLLGRKADIKTLRVSTRLGELARARYQFMYPCTIAWKLLAAVRFDARL